MLTNLPLLGIGAVGAAVALLVLRAAPRGTVVVWAVCMFFVPVWVGVSVGVFWSAGVAVTALAVATNLGRIRPTPADAIIVVFALLVVGLCGLSLITLSAAVQAILEWLLPYAWGRLILQRVNRETLTACLATVATVAAALALLEFVTGTNVFVLMPAMSDSYAIWGTLQARGSFVRAEGAFGHSIALGATLAMSAAFILTTRWRNSVKVGALAIVAGAILATFSRIGLISLVLTIVGTVVLLPDIGRRTRIVVASLGVFAAVAVAPIVSAVFLEAGDEAAGSADYRLRLAALLPRVRLLGSAGEWDGLVSGGIYLGAFARSIDNAFLVMALRLGWIPTALLVIVLVGIVVRAVRRSTSSPAALAVAAQLPSLLAVALITQFGMFFWFMVGLALSWHHPPEGARSDLAAVADEHAQVMLNGVSRSTAPPPTFSVPRS